MACRELPDATDAKNWQSGTWDKDASPYRVHGKGVCFELYCKDAACKAHIWAKEHNLLDSDLRAAVIYSCSSDEKEWNVLQNYKCPGCQQERAVQNIYLNNVTATIEGTIYNSDTSAFEPKLPLVKTVGDHPEWCNAANKQQFSELKIHT